MGTRSEGETRDGATVADQARPRVGTPLSVTALVDAPVISERTLAAAGVPVQVVTCAAVGGGMGSFAWVDLLRNSGLPQAEIAVVTDESPGGWRYRRYVANSQMRPPHDRIRSNSESTPDNPWGFPGLAAREAWGQLRRGRVWGAVRPLVQVLGEPVVTQTYTPRAEDVFRQMDREAERIGWPEICRQGEVIATRKSEEGRLVALARREGRSGEEYFGVAAQFLQVAVGYPAVNLLPEVLRYRERGGGPLRVVNAYEPHEHVYRALVERGGTVLVRGRGIVASCILERLWEARERNRGIHVVHLHRSRLVSGHRLGFATRPSGDDFEYQPFNWPKGCWGGELRVTIERAGDERRRELHEVLGGTTTADRALWRRIVRDGRHKGWYQPEYGMVREFRDRGGAVVAHVADGADQVREIVADFVIDCTGMAAEPEKSPLLADLIHTYGVPKNGLGRIAVSNGFEVEAARHDDARLYACGAMTMGGPLASVDTFLGLQYTALRTAHDMHGVDPAKIRVLNGWFSVRQWSKWARGKAP